VHRHRPDLEPAHVEQVVHEAGEPVERTVRVLQQLLPVAHRQLDVTRAQARHHGLGGRERRPQVVPDSRQQRRTQAVGCLDLGGRGSRRRPPLGDVDDPAHQRTDQHERHQRHHVVRVLDHEGVVRPGEEEVEEDGSHARRDQCRSETSDQCGHDHEDQVDRHVAGQVDRAAQRDEDRQRQARRDHCGAVPPGAASRAECASPHPASSVLDRQRHCGAPSHRQVSAHTTYAARRARSEGAKVSSPGWTMTHGYSHDPDTGPRDPHELLRP
jgi:hypothetical protein